MLPRLATTEAQASMADDTWMEEFFNFADDASEMEVDHHETIADQDIHDAANDVEGVVDGKLCHEDDTAPVDMALDFLLLNSTMSLNHEHSFPLDDVNVLQTSQWPSDAELFGDSQELLPDILQEQPSMMTADPTTQIHDTGTESNIHIDWAYSTTIPTAQNLTPFGSEAISSHIPAFSSSALSYSQPPFDNDSQTLISLHSYLATSDTVSYDPALLSQFTQYDPDFGISGLSIIDPFDQPAQPESTEPTTTTKITPAPKKRYPSYFPDSLANTLERGGNGKKSTSGTTSMADGGPCDAKHVARGIVRYILFYIPEDHNG